ncbi:lipopolysaccharide biosynthesis protein [Anaeromyxobacter oryzae]|uniref:Polysaccharide biosynthesis protein n=1 Tax=Anaeromyxobacter oryzae TaxID=2918170 RepID=A0ABM7WVA5_9BACT|nr:oligosaccharide flippase family protein [Anaeromyxobacter oryzae]BDG03443.1 hypothetical protein AMOR_24390 [Anaeromyxobacter oryzae]
MTGQCRAVPDLAPRQFGKNLAVNIASLGTSTLVGFFLAPFLVRKLGVAGYGLVPLTYSIVNYLYVANVALNAATARNISIALTRGDRAQAIDIFSTALWGSLALGVVLLVIGVGLSFSAPSLIRIPAGFEPDARVLLMAATANLVLVLVSSPLSVAIYYTNRLDKKGQIEIVNRVVNVGLVVFLVTAVSARPAMVGLALLASGIVSLLQTVTWLMRRMPWLKPRLMFDREVFVDLLQFGGWSVVAFTGNMVFLTIDVILVNRLIGPVEGGIYGALMQWPTMIRALATTVASVFSQPMAHIYAKDGPEGLSRHSVRAVRILAAVVLVPTVVVAGSARPLLKLWLGEAIAPWWPLLLLVIVHLGYNLATMPLVTALQTVRKVRAIGMITCLAGVLDVGLAVLVVRTTTLGAYGVALASAAAFTLLGAVLMPLYAKTVFGIPARATFSPVVKAASLAIVGALVGNVISVSCGVSGWRQLLALASALTATTAASSFYFVLSAADRDSIRRMLAESMRGLKA